MRIILVFFMFGLIAALSGVSGAQSSSLYLRENVTPTVPNRADVSKTANGQPNLLSPAIAKVSFAAVSLPKPRTFAKHDLITIIVRESTENNSKSTLDTEKETKVAGELSDFPNISVKDLLNFQLGASDFSRGKPKIGLDLSTEFEGEGNFKRKDTFVTRITAEIIDVKPNGLLVLEARKFIRTNKETLNLVLSGSCRSKDVGPGNTVLSTEIHNLRLVKDHDGEIRKSTRKGVITRVFEGLFGP